MIIRTREKDFMVAIDLTAIIIRDDNCFVGIYPEQYFYI